MYSIYKEEAFNKGKQNQQCKLPYQGIKNSGPKKLDAPQSKAFKVTLLVQMYSSQKGWTFTLENKCDDLPTGFLNRYNFIKISI